MKVSRTWLSRHFDAPLPPVEALADALTFHAFEVEEIEGDHFEVKVLPNRAADCLSHRGIAREVSAILDLPLAKDPLRESPVLPSSSSNQLSVQIEDPKKCSRYIGALVRGVKVGPSPEWLKEALESVGQRSINNVVDATNFVMLDMGQPLHAFDAGKLTQKDGGFAIGVRAAKAEEPFTTLSGEEYLLPEGTTLITDAHADAAIGIAGIKGGKTAEVDARTVDIVLESAHFDGPSTRRTAQVLKLFTEAGQRFQNRPPPELAAYGMQSILSLIQEIAGGEVVCAMDEYPLPPTTNPTVSTTLAQVNAILGSDFSGGDVHSVCTRLGLSVEEEGEALLITAPFERTDIQIPEDIAEEIGRILGYDRVQAAELPAVSETPDQAHFRGIEQAKDTLVTAGFTEISTQSFAKRGDIELLNPLDKERPALRTSLAEHMRAALEIAKHYAPRVLPPSEKPKLFEVGTVFPLEGERLAVEVSESSVAVLAIEDDAVYEPLSQRLGAYKPFSAYPFALRDIAVWLPEGASPEDTHALITTTAGTLLVRADLFDTFEKSGRTSAAFRLVFESPERTLSESEIGGCMEAISGALAKAGYEVR